MKDRKIWRKKVDLDIHKNPFSAVGREKKTHLLIADAFYTIYYAISTLLNDETTKIVAQMGQKGI